MCNHPEYILSKHTISVDIKTPFYKKKVTIETYFQKNERIWVNWKYKRYSQLVFVDYKDAIYWTFYYYNFKNQENLSLKEYMKKYF